MTIAYAAVEGQALVNVTIAYADVGLYSHTLMLTVLFFRLVPVTSLMVAG